jgi:hypothetical protein
MDLIQSYETNKKIMLKIQLWNRFSTDSQAIKAKVKATGQHIQVDINPTKVFVANAEFSVMLKTS